ncbi:uracil-xanthine permease family protein [Spiroplasma tabanidicola]|uniref:Uracil permease n=1 Tax=Spiroplasma tabanidicola TaxID=324079 RepID=A0A6I6CEA9_9MOLU|nr:uracil-xanthine permease family protein [Spiroplasma tabanidicola]QGS52462.1 uracil permease [Spiroplasma tabanidicola]
MEQLNNNDKQELTKVELILEPHQRPKNVGKWILLSVQHVFAMFGATVLVPMIMNSISTNNGGGNVMNISMALFCSGVGTLIYIAFTSAKVPLYLGSSFAYMTTIGLGFKDWGNAVFIGVFVVGVVYVLMGFIIYWTGSSWVKKAFSPVVTGPIIIIIGMSAISSALQNIGLWNNASEGWIRDEASNTSYPQWLAILLGFITIVVAAICVLKAKTFFKAIPILLALIVGYILAIIIHYAAKGEGVSLLDTSLITNVKDWQWYPSFKAIWNVKGNQIGPALVAIVPIAIITMTEHLGEHINIGSITNRDFVSNPGIHRTLIADGVSIMFAGAVGGPANATYAENTSVVNMTRIASVWAIGLAAIFAIVLSFIAPFNQLISMIPKPVMGGIGVVLFGMIASNGIKILVEGKVNFGNAKNIFVIAITLAIGVGLGVTGTEISWGNSGFKFTGLFIATIVGVLLNILLPNQLNDGLFKMNFIDNFKRDAEVRKTNKEKKSLKKINQAKTKKAKDRKDNK